jgi:hypothetical protein
MMYGMRIYPLFKNFEQNRDNDKGYFSDNVNPNSPNNEGKHGGLSLLHFSDHDIDPFSPEILGENADIYEVACIPSLRVETNIGDTCSGLDDIFSVKCKGKRYAVQTRRTPKAVASHVVDVA